MIKVAVVGAGHWGPNLIGNLHNHTRSEVAWVIDRSEARLDVVRTRFPDIATDTDVPAVFEDPAVDAVVIATPTTTHYELTLAALRAGKHVLVEKPLADTVDKAIEMDAVAREVGKTLMVGHVFVYNAAAQLAKQYITNRELGRVYYISMVRTNLGPIRVDVNAAYDLAAHDISLASYWLDGAPLSVTATGGSWINRGIEDAVFATLRYPNDVLVNLHASWLNPLKTRDIRVVGDKRMLTFDDVNASEPLRIYDKQVDEQTAQVPFVDSLESFRMTVREGDIVVPRVPMSQPLKQECDHFLDCLEGGLAPMSGGPEGIAVVRALDAISRSMADKGREAEVGR
ncbi:MAG: Gfo/Idh/MocA family oxidoreductase [bacterium]|nr:Gfo/Idh/MocA family oxidoreductase [bacterium]